MPVSLAERVDGLVAQGRVRDAYLLLSNPAGTDAADALFLLAVWRIRGGEIRRDLPAARHLFRRAAEAGHGSGALIHAYLLANGTGGERDWPQAFAILQRLAPSTPAAATQIALLGSMAINDHGQPTRLPTPRALSGTPYAAVFKSFLSPQEASYIQRASEERLQPSVVVDPGSGRLTLNPIRRSDDAVFGVLQEDLVINAIACRIAAASGTSSEQGEPLLVLRYQPGGEYRAHSDALAGADNQRTTTVLLYLNDDYRGGETRFVETGLTVRGRTGDALLFRNVTADGRPDPMSRHAGLPVTHGTKWLATRWIRQNRYTYPAPSPLLNA